MLTAIIVGENSELVQYLRQLCAEFGDICVYKHMDGASRRYDVAATLSSYEPDVAFVDITNLDKPDSLAAVCLQELLPGRLRTVVVPYAKVPPPDSSVRTLGVLAGPVLTPPFDADELDRALRAALRRRASTGASLVLAILPAKPGDGASTLAINLAGATANTFRKRTLYIEADLRSGAICYRLQLQPRLPLGDIFVNAGNLMEGWSGAVSPSHGFDVLPTGGSPQTMRGSRWDFYRLLRFAREQYEVVVVDLPAAIDEVAESVIAEADRVVMVCTPEPSSLGLISRRMRDLESGGTRHGHLRLLVNRYAAGDPAPGDMARTARREVTGLLPEDARSVKTACRLSTLLSKDSRLQAGIVDLAGALLQVDPPGRPVSLLERLKRAVRQVVGSHCEPDVRTSAINWNVEHNSVACDLRGRR